MSDNTPREDPYQSPGAMPPISPATGGWMVGPSIPAGAVLASYGQRVAAYLIDALIALLLTVPGTVLIVVAALSADDGGVNGGLIAVGVVLILVGVAVHVWNQGWRQGVIGQSWGKGIMHIRLVRVADGVPPGGGIGLARYFLRQLLGNATGGIYTVVDLLWPLWDDRRQTLDDKIVSTLVVEAR
jgi:uncharacterized RDD family membrane protein YckC